MRRTRVKLVAEAGSGRLLGGQIVGVEGAAKRIDVLAVAVWTGVAVGDLELFDLSYAPPFSLPSLLMSPFLPCRPFADQAVDQEV